MNLSKKEIRKTCLERISNIADRTERSFLMKEELLNILKGYKYIGLFMSLDNEIDTTPLVQELLNLNKNVYLPRTEGDVIRFYKLNNINELEISDDKYKVRQPVKGIVVDPSSLEVIVCPGVAFDKNNNRMGHGKGYYDKYLSHCPALKIGVCYKEQLLDEIPSTPLDIKMDRVCAY